MRELTLVLIGTILITSGCMATAQSLPDGNFQAIPQYEGSFEGSIYLSGYAELEEVVEPFCDKDCDLLTYVNFIFVDYGQTPGFEEFMNINQGNSFVDKANSSIGLGCLLGDNIVYSNSTDNYEITNAPLGSILTDKILKSSPNQTLKLKLTKKIYTSGKGAPACYSHFSVIESFNQN
jgi:hypothetical protein